MSKTESTAARARRRMAFGMVEQAATILGATSSSVLVVGLVVPTIAAIGGNANLDQSALLGVSLLVAGFSAFAAVSAIVLRGLARQLEDAETTSPSDHV